jgi:hypothetical protein
VALLADHIDDIAETANKTGAQVRVTFTALLSASKAGTEILTEIGYIRGVKVKDKMDPVFLSNQQPLPFPAKGQA